MTRNTVDRKAYHRIYMRTYVRNWRAKARGAVWQKSGGHCWYCGTVVALPLIHRSAPLQNAMHVEHLLPGGGDALENLVPSCRFCNLSKGKDDVEILRMRLWHRDAGIPVFTPEQRKWLGSVGFQFPAIQYEFWFERRSQPDAQLEPVPAGSTVRQHGGTGT